MFKIVFHKKVEKFLEKRDNKFLKTFKKQILELSLNPYNNKLDIKHFDSNPGSYRLRISKYRFIYKIIKKDILIFFYEADKRGDIY